MGDGGVVREAVEQTGQGWSTGRESGLHAVLQPPGTRSVSASAGSGVRAASRGWVGLPCPWHCGACSADWAATKDSNGIVKAPGDILTVVLVNPELVGGFPK